MGAELPIGQPEHQAITQRVQLISGPRLRNAGTCGGAGLGKGCHRNRDGPGESRVDWSREIDVELEKVERIAAEQIDEEVRFASGGRRGAVQVRRQKREILRGGGETD